MKNVDRLAAGGSSFAPNFPTARRTLLCFSHLRWDFVYQRPQHLMSRFASEYDVLFLEEPVPAQGAPLLVERRAASGVSVLVPHLPAGTGAAESDRALRSLLNDRLRRVRQKSLLLWYYTPMSLAFSAHLSPALVVYDCMDELSAFRGAPPQLVQRETQLLSIADVVFTGGVSLYEAKRVFNPNTHPFPSSVDLAHFTAARGSLPEPADQAAIPGPRMGFYGVIDERFDVALLDELAARRPDWSFVMVGPVVKIDAAVLPRRPNIHYLGQKPYSELPAYLGGWSVALMPFARNESTRFISPTKTPEYLAAGRPVVSTPITDVVRMFGNTDIVHIAADACTFERAIEIALEQARDRHAFMASADAVLRGMSWDLTWRSMHALMHRADPGQGRRAAPAGHGHDDEPRSSRVVARTA
ncbi:MAG: glycosyltransferase family 1 protein [Pigmentiphaga sp.]|uniref:glycosyltransferase family 1 protein n=1 Tax=Pigmentiphaga sp. TaxID=1977564 RepID=UPI0029B996A2|nr:glycosyltransferase family 1 protein [Pigmentiphaga sp.]MDX3905162.1 glycosyltransferase family 1 protein [Pigmentiphaga sp.]